MKLLSLLALAFFSAAISYAQVTTCDGARYSTATFTPTETLGIQFGNATTIGGNNQDLFLDFYEPAGDMVAERPLIILAFGGSFISGSRESMDWMCEYYAALGYTAATIDYRLYDGAFIPFPDSVDMTEEVLMAVSDMKAAIRFFKEDAATTNTYRIDTNNIFIGGISAGAITASHVALMDSNDVIESYIQPILAANGGWTGNSSTNTQYTDDVRAVLNFSGALRKATYIDANDPAIFSVHDDGDDVVPYGLGAASVAGFPIINMEGSLIMDQQAQSVGIPSQLTTFNVNGHVSYFQSGNATANAVLQSSADFLFDIVCPQYANVNEFAVNETLTISPNPTETIFTVSWEDEDVQSIQLVDVMGNVLKSVIPNTNVYQFDVSNFASGVYFIRIEAATGASVRTVQKV